MMIEQEPNHKTTNIQHTETSAILPTVHTDSPPPIPKWKTILKLIFKWVPLFSGPIIAFPFLFDILYPGHISVSRTAAVTILVAIYWFFEPIPMAITSLFPVLLFPLLGVVSADEISSAYFNDLIFLFIGSYCVAIALEKWNLHKRFALKILLLIGLRPKLILFGFMIISYLLSMWLSNTCTAAMLVPMAHAIMTNLKESEQDKRFAKSVIMAIPFSCSIGGLATLVGTATNLVFAGQMRELFPNYGGFGFVQWSMFALPLSAFIIFTTWILFIIFYVRRYKFKQGANDFFKNEYEKLGKIKLEEMLVIPLFALMCLLWILRELPIGDGIGWGKLFKPKFVTDGTVAIFICVLLFVIPSKNIPGDRLLDWKTANKKIPWNIVLLLGAGFALAKGFSKGGFSEFMADVISHLGALPAYLFLLIVCLVTCIWTQVSSNVAVASILLPVLAKLSVTPKVSQNPLFLMIPATVSCSFAFLTPIATPPNGLC